MTLSMRGYGIGSMVRSPVTSQRCFILAT